MCPQPSEAFLLSETDLDELDLDELERMLVEIGENDGDVRNGRQSGKIRLGRHDGEFRTNRSPQTSSRLAVDGLQNRRRPHLRPLRGKRNRLG